MPKAIYANLEVVTPSDTDYLTSPGPIMVQNVATVVILPKDAPNSDDPGDGITLVNFTGNLNVEVKKVFATGTDGSANILLYK